MIRRARPVRLWPVAATLAVLIALFCAAAPAPLAAQTAPAAEAARAGLEARRAALFRQMLARPTDLDVAFAYAMLSAEVGDFEAGVATLERMLVFAPDSPRLKLELAVMYYRLGAYDRARENLDAVRALDLPPPVRARVELFSAVVAREARPYRFSGMVTAGIQGHSNANAAPGQDVITIGGLPIILGPGARATPDGSVFGLGRFHFTHQLPGQGSLLEADLTLYHADYFTQNQLDLSLAEVSVGPSFSLGALGIDRARLGLYGIGGIVLLNGQQYSGSYGAGARVRGVTQGGVQIEAGAEYRSVNYVNSPAYPTAGLQSGGEVRAWTHLSRRFGAQWTGTLAFDTRFVTGQTAFKSFAEYGVSARANRTFRGPAMGPAGGIVAADEPWTLSLAAGVLARDFGAPDPFIAPGTVQRDTGYWVEATLAVPLRNRFAAFVTGQYRGQGSTYATRAYDGVSVTLGVSRRF